MNKISCDIRVTNASFYQHRLLFSVSQQDIRRLEVSFGTLIYHPLAGMDLRHHNTCLRFKKTNMFRKAELWVL